MTAQILVTGASRGFGAALAAAFAQRGARVFAGARGTGPVLDGLVRRYPGMIVPVELDVVSDDSIRRARNAVAAESNALDVVVNNAAIRSATVMNPIEGIDFADVMRTFDVNSVGPLRVVQSFLPLLRKAAAPVLVNVSSEAGSIGACRRDREFDYCMSKAALNMATSLLANYLQGQVRVLSLHPGWLRTDMGGAHAALDPETTATAVSALILAQAGRSDGPLFVDHEGRALPW